MHSSDYSRGNNANHFHEQEHQHLQISFQNEKKEEIDDEGILRQIETQLTSTDVIESVFLPLSLSPNELTRSNEEDGVGILNGSQDTHAKVLLMVD